MYKKSQEISWDFLIIRLRTTSAVCYNIVMKVNGDSVSNEDKIKEFLDKNHGYISTSEILSLNISKPLIKNMSKVVC